MSSDLDLARLPARAGADRPDDHGFLLDAELAESIQDVFKWQQYEHGRLDEAAKAEIGERKRQIVASNDAVVADGGFDTSEGAQVLPAPHAAENIRVGDIERPFTGRRVPITRICTVNADTLTAALVVGDACALNFANADRPGGMYRSGGRAQEEDLCCQMPQLYAALAVSEYPIEPGTALLNKGLQVLRRPCTYELCLSLGEVDIITAAMPNGYPSPGTPDWNESVKLRIRAVLKAGIHSGKPNLVLGAFGCGMFGNPPDKVAKIFREQLSSAEFRGAFTNLIFAIIGPDENRGAFVAMASRLAHDIPFIAHTVPLPFSAMSQKAPEKKVRQITDLEERQAKGEELNRDQLGKLANEKQIQSALNALSAAGAPAPKVAPAKAKAADMQTQRKGTYGVSHKAAAVPAADAVSAAASEVAPAVTPDQKAPTPAAPAPAAPAPAAAPNRKALEKKLRQINEIEEKKNGGAELNNDQLAKLASKKQVEADLRKC